MRIVGFGVCGPGEADKYLEQTLDEFERLCDETYIIFNNAKDAEKEAVKRRGFFYKEDNREWGTHQHKIKQEGIYCLSDLEPDWVITLDMDERFSSSFNRREAEELANRGGLGYFFYIVNLYKDGYTPEWSFWNNRMFKYDDNLAFANKPLHPGLAPEKHWKWSNYAPFLVIHYGLKDKAERDRRTVRYTKYDPHAKYVGKAYYDFLKQDIQATPFDEAHIEKEVREEVRDYKHKEPSTMRDKRKQEYDFWRRKKDGFVFDAPVRHREQYQKSGKFELISDEPVKKTGGPVETTEPVREQEAPKSVPESSTPAEHDEVSNDGDELDERTCDQCGFVAKTSSGLRLHSRKHE